MMADLQPVHMRCAQAARMEGKKKWWRRRRRRRRGRKTDDMHLKLSHKEPITSVVTGDPSLLAPYCCRKKTKQNKKRSGGGALKSEAEGWVGGGVMAEKGWRESS